MFGSHHCDPYFSKYMKLREFWHTAGRHRHGGRHGRFGWGGHGGFGGFGRFDDLMRGRQFSSDDLQLLLLALIAQQSRHGYELIKELEARSNGFYNPSPGMVYPALTYLEELGYVTVQMEGNRKRYELSDAGRAHLEANREHVDHMLAKLKLFAEKMDTVRRAFAGEESVERAEWIAELVEARHALRHALRRADMSVDEQRRIAAILARAAAEIERK
jgi:DNA-binding PadR family transcriptional regulator